MTDPSDTRPRILIVDDHPPVAKLLTLSLEDEYAIRVAESGQEALQAARLTPPPDLILLDVLMAEMDGFEVCERLKADPETAMIPVIFVTGVDDHINEERGLSMGAVDYISKPVKPPVVRARVRLHLRLKQHQDFLESLVERRTGELEAAREEARRWLAKIREDDTVRNPRR